MIWTSFAHSDCRLRLKSSLHIGRNLSATIQHRTKYWQSMKQLLDSGALPTTISAPHKGADDCYFNAISLMSLKTPLRLGVQVGTLGERLQPADQNNKSSENRCTRRLTCMIQSVWLSAEYEDRDWPTGNQSKHNNDSKSVYKKTRLLNAWMIASGTTLENSCTIFDPCRITIKAIEKCHPSDLMRYCSYRWDTANSGLPTVKPNDCLCSTSSFPDPLKGIPLRKLPSRFDTVSD